VSMPNPRDMDIGPLLKSGERGKGRFLCGSCGSDDITTSATRKDTFIVFVVACNRCGNKATFRAVESKPNGG
jgi:transcription elongation factor Elf1